MNTIILAAGRGSRLGRYTEDRPKGLLGVGPSTILERQVESLAHFLRRPPVIVVGYRGELIRKRLEGRARFIDNPFFETTNSLYSLWLARDYLREGFLLLNGDVIFHPAILARLLRSPFADALTFERKKAFDGEEMKVRLDGERVIAISKDLDAADGESLGILKFSPAGATVLLERLEELLPVCAARCWSPCAVNNICPLRPVGAVDVSDLPWVEVDFPSDLDVARRQVIPRIDGTLWPGQYWKLVPGREEIPLDAEPALVGARG